MKLLNLLKEVKDNRKRSGRRYPLYSLLSIILLSRLCGYKSIKSAWYLCRSLHYKQLIQPGFTRHGRPGYDVFLEALQRLDIASLESVLSRLSDHHLPKDSIFNQLCMDGKRLKGRKTSEGKAYHLLSLFCSDIDSVYGQLRSHTGGGEICAAMNLLSRLDLGDKVISGDAMFSSSRLCKKIEERGGYYAFTLKSNRQELYHEVVHAFRLHPWPETLRYYKEEVVKDHGRIEYREIRVMNLPYGHYTDGFKTIKQIAQIKRYRCPIGSTKKNHVTTAYMITNLDEAKTSPKALLSYNRKHWSIENRLHRTRDTLYDEDRQTLRSGHAPQASSALSNLALFVINKYKKMQKESRSLEHLTQAFARDLKIPIKMMC